MPEFWQFPTGSMGIGPISAIYQARFMRYLEHRGLARTRDRHVWGVFGDGEMDEPESIARPDARRAREARQLTFIINCNLQRLDGPVRGNGQVIQELESLFTGAGWNVIKVLWGSDWDPLFARDTDHVLLRQLAATVDGQYQTLGANDGAYNQEHFFKLAIRSCSELVAHMSAKEIDALQRGGHDFRKLYAAFAAARAHRGQPTVILAKTKKGYGMGGAGEIAHDLAPAEEARRRGAARVPQPLRPAAVRRRPRARCASSSPPTTAARWATCARAARRSAAACRARSAAAPPLPVPPLAGLRARSRSQADGKEMSTTMALVRMLTTLLRDRTLGPAHRADRRRRGAHLRHGEPVPPDRHLFARWASSTSPRTRGSMLAYREARDGQLLEEGITEAGALSSWVAAATRTACTACRCCRSTSTTRSSASSASAT